ncbi:O-antigen polymerase [Acinetobacter haemolyticus]|uniref:O-antigen polymerase n=1 Tax=Acinetobacter haemolyticus TaxID=29430 RepID=UPI0021CD1FCF|nr:O-antigen polymerase [Acinetobacter haemolyticus]MCU4377715.1 oligosaccharide repeat unit polymerase [Acinetobacter haemolyticus]
MKFNLTETIESKFFMYIVSIIYKMLLDFSYVYFVYPLFEYAGFQLNISSSVYIFSWLIYLFIVFITPNILTKLSDCFFSIFTFSVLAPLLSMYGLNYLLSFYPVGVSLIVFIVMRLMLYVSIFPRKIIYPYVKNGDFYFKFICIAMILYLISWYFISGAVSNFNLDVSKVYDYRDVNAELTNFGIFSYLNSWVSKVFSLSIMAYFLLKKNYYYFIFFLAIQIFFFGVSAHKSVLFSPLIIIGIYFYLSRTKSLATFPLGFSILISLCLATFYIYNDIVLSSIFIRRMFFIPSYLSFEYFNFFQDGRFAWWTNSFSFLGAPVYPEGIPQTVGNYLSIDEDGARANNGFISSGFAQAGFIGVTLYTLLLVFILKIIDSFSKSVGHSWFALCILIVPLRSLLISSDLLTVLLTHGLIVAIFLLFLLRKRNLNNAI